MAKSSFKYDITFSFAEEDRKIIEPIAIALKEQGVKIFYDKFEKASLWGCNLFDYLHNLYSEQTRYVAIFISKSYVEKDWTRLERQVSQSKALKSKEPFILPVMLEKVKVPGFSETVLSLDYKEEGQDKIVQFILKKLDVSNRKTYPEVPEITKNIETNILLIEIRNYNTFIEDQLHELHFKILPDMIFDNGSENPPKSDDKYLYYNICFNNIVLMHNDTEHIFFLSRYIRNYFIINEF